MEKSKNIVESPKVGKKGIAGKVVQFGIPLVVTVGLCVAMFRDIDFGEMMAVIRQDCDFRWIALMLAISIAPMMLRGLRWGIQLKALGIDVPTHALVLSIFGTYGVNIVFPRLGEVWRSGYISYRQKAPFSAVFGSMIGDRFADLLTVGLLTLLTFIIARGPIVDFVRTYPAAYQAIANILGSPWFWGVMIVLAGGAWWLLARSKNSIVLKIKRFVLGMWEGFAALARMEHKWRWLGLTACIWGCYFLQLVVAFRAFPLTSQMLDANGLTLPLVCFILTSISMGIPSNGGIGPYQTTLIFGLTLFAPAGVAHSQFMTVGAAFGNVIIASQTVLLIILGLITFIWIALEKRRSRQAAAADSRPQG